MGRAGEPDDLGISRFGARCQAEEDEGLKDDDDDTEEQHTEEHEPIKGHIPGGPQDASAHAPSSLSIVIRRCGASIKAYLMPSCPERRVCRAPRACAEP